MPFKLLVVPESTGDHWPKALMLEKSAKNVTVIELKIDIAIPSGLFLSTLLSP